MNPQELADRIHNQNNYKHRILYYGRSSKTCWLPSSISPGTSSPRKGYSAGNKFSYLETPATKVLVAPYEAKQIYMAQISNLDKNIWSGYRTYPRIIATNISAEAWTHRLPGNAWNTRTGLFRMGRYNAAKLSEVSIYYVPRLQLKMTRWLMPSIRSTILSICQNEAAFKIGKEGLINRMRTDRIIKTILSGLYQCTGFGDKA